ncbi:nucleoside hydrolase [Saccharopolyspora hattusasensis]|uniref:nucleoside hydrolase n=1 Tax=Saccharopolyspora hattusasensis TaxID=1128679 RepID=UPI003D98CBD6
MKVTLDVDTGSDDAVAIMLAALHPDLELVGCTTVCGNLPVEVCTDNTLRVLDAIGRSDVPVHSGLGAPIGPARLHHGPDPGKRTGHLVHRAKFAAPPTSLRTAETGAVEYLLETYRRPSDVVLVATAPLTNLAAALILDPAIAANVPELVIMGGGHEVGNVTPAAEANIWHDPAAAAIVLSAGFPRLTLVTLDATHRALVSAADCDELAASGTAAATLAAVLIRERIEGYAKTQPMAVPNTAPVHDPLCLAYLVDPNVLRLTRANVVVEQTGEYTYGRTVIDTHDRSGRPAGADVALDADADLFVRLLRSTLTTPPLCRGGSA